MRQGLGFPAGVRKCVTPGIYLLLKYAPQDLRAESRTSPKVQRGFVQILLHYGCIERAEECVVVDCEGVGFAIHPAVRMDRPSGRREYQIARPPKISLPSTIVLHWPTIP
ncbi:hypothetical protein CIT31_28705 [Mesorhizobium wenxiniae]|uniref:Uncharacterized protein n=1 Tax=Mesorhizobium wenxiniae TaxID=2014805 RepID=A0A271K9Y8_9HYPH|nr:hypothetical protein CIT31_28705 [Mesorhizobium wenxiniae]